MKFVLKDENKSLERREVWCPVSLKCWFLAPHEALWCGEGFSLLASKRHSPYTQRNSTFSGSDLPANSRVVQNSGLFRGYHETCPPCWLKKPAQRQSCDFSFIWEQIEDCNPGDSTSESSEQLLQRGSGGRSTYKILVKGSSMQSVTYFTRGFLLVTRSWCHHEGI